MVLQKRQLLSLCNDDVSLATRSEQAYYVSRVGPYTSVGKQTVKHFRLNHEDQRYFFNNIFEIIINIIPLHLNTYGIGLWPYTILIHSLQGSTLDVRI